MSAPSLLLWRLAALPTEHAGADLAASIAVELEDPASESAREATPKLIAAAEWVIRGASLTGADLLALTLTERAAIAVAGRRVDAQRALELAKAFRGGVHAASVLAIVDREAAEEAAFVAMAGRDR